MRRKSVLFCSVVVLLALAVVCCRRHEDKKPPDTLVIGTMTDLENWNPYLADSAFADDLLSLVYPTLMIEGADYRSGMPTFEPWLAESWEYSEDRRKIVFRLREGAVWSDGVPVTAEDVVFTYRIQVSDELAWPGSEIKRHIVDVRALDDYVVEFIFDRPYPYQLMDANEGPIVPKHAWGQIPLDRWEEQDWLSLSVSGGPYIPVAHKPQQEIVLERNPRFWVRGQPYIRRLAFRVVPDQAMLVSQLLSGRLDMVQSVPPHRAADVQRHPGLRLITFPDRSYTYIGWNNRKPPFDGAKLRRALGMAIDREAIVRSALLGYGKVAVGPVLSTVWAFDPGLKPLEFDPEGAKEILRELGWEDTDGNGVLDRGGAELRFQLMTNAGNAVRVRVAQMVQRDLGAVGVAVRVRTVEWGAMLDMLEQGNFEAYISAWREGTQVDPAPLWCTPTEGQPTYNWIGYSNPEVDALVAKLEAAQTLKEQLPILHKFQRIIVADQPYTFLYESQRLVGLSSRVVDAQINDASPFFHIERWRLRQESE